MVNLDGFFLFDNLTYEEKKQITESLPTAEAYKKGETIYSAESYSKAIGFVISGRVIATADNSHGTVMREFCSGMCFGAAAVFTDGKRYISIITAKSDCLIQFVPESLLRTLFALYPQTAVNYIIFLSNRIRFLNNKINVISCGSTDDTVMRYLITSADADGTAQLPDNMTHLSRMLSIGRASLYRSLDSLEKKGLINRENNIIRMQKK